MGQKKIMVVEDERIVAEDIQRCLRKLGYAVSFASSGEKAIKDLEKNPADLVLMDIVLKGEKDGIETAGIISSTCGIPVVYLTAYSDKEILERAKITGPFGYIIKPYNERELYTVIETSLYRHEMEKRLRDSEYLLAATLRSLGEAVVVTDKEGKIKIMNPYAEALAGWDNGNAAGKNLQTVFNIINEENGEKVEDPVKKAIKEGAFYGLSINTALVLKDGQVLPVDIIGSVIKDDNDNIIGISFIFDDIAERKKIAEKLRKR
ncbi:MAG: response regulator [Candidatus Methanoperedens sp.]|nr:response regulator [Candidatus Methanoperedens sp.]